MWLATSLFQAPSLLTHYTADAYIEHLQFKKKKARTIQGNELAPTIQVGVTEEGDGRSIRRRRGGERSMSTVTPVWLPTCIPGIAV